jgi:hypothetical protein
MRIVIRPYLLVKSARDVTPYKTLLVHVLIRIRVEVAAQPACNLAASIQSLFFFAGSGLKTSL